jgi:hypothetical protein
MSHSEKCLKFILRLNGALAIMAVVAVFMPQSWLVWCVGKVEPDLFAGFLVSYLARALSMYFVLAGVLLLIFSGDVDRYRVPITCVAFWVLFAILSFGTYCIGHLPELSSQWFFWFVVGDATYSLLFAIAILLLQLRIRHGKNVNVRGLAEDLHPRKEALSE